MGCRICNRLGEYQRTVVMGDLCGRPDLAYFRKRRTFIYLKNAETQGLDGGAIATGY